MKSLFFSIVMNKQTLSLDSIFRTMNNKEQKKILERFKLPLYHFWQGKKMFARICRLYEDDCAILNILSIFLEPNYYVCMSVSIISIHGIFL